MKDAWYMDHVLKQQTHLAVSSHHTFSFLEKFLDHTQCVYLPYFGGMHFWPFLSWLSVLKSREHGFQYCAETAWERERDPFFLIRKRRFLICSPTMINHFYFGQIYACICTTILTRYMMKNPFIIYTEFIIRDEMLQIL